MHDAVSISWSLWTLVLVAWVTCWIALGARGVAKKAGDERIQFLQTLLPAFTVSTLLSVFALGWQPQSVLSVMVLWWHHAAILALFCFLAVGQFFQAEAWWNIKNERFRGAAASYQRLWLLTELLPAPIALTIFLTGLRLIWEAANARPPAQGKSPATFWLLAIIVGFSFFFWDGILGYTPIVRKWKTLWGHVPADDPPLDLSRRQPQLSDSLQLLVHFLSWPVVFLCGVYRWEIANPATDFVGHAIHKLGFLPTGWPEVLVAATVWLVAGGIVAAIRFAAKIKK